MMQFVSGIYLALLSPRLRRDARQGRGWDRQIGPVGSSTDGGTMLNELPNRVTRLLLAWSGGDPAALAALMPLIYDELHQMAARYMVRESAGHTLQPTALVHEFFLRVQGRRQVNWKNRKHFFGFAAQTMRIILIDHLRRLNSHKRGGGEVPVSLGEVAEGIPSSEPNLEILELRQVLERLAAADPRAAEVVKLRFFAGMSVKETAAALELSQATVKRQWRLARRWLYRELRETSGGGSGGATLDAGKGPCRGPLNAVAPSWE